MRYSVASLDREVRRSHLSRCDRVHSKGKTKMEEQNTTAYDKASLKQALQYTFTIL